MALPILQPESARGDPSAELPTVRALEALLAEVQKLWMGWPTRWGRYLRLWRQMSLRQVDPDKVRLVTPHGKVNDCAGCTDSCCIGPKSTVLLRLRDIAALIDTNKTALMTHRKPTFDAQTLALRPALTRQLHSHAWATMPVLKQNAFGACLALDTEGRCTLYPHWPMSCARFPLALDVETHEIFYAQRCQSYWIHPDEDRTAKAMARAAVSAYNARIQDALLLAFARPQLARLGITRYLSL